MEYKLRTHELEWNRDMHYALGFSKLWCRALGIWPWKRNKISTARFALLFGLEVAAVVSLLERLLTHGNCGSVTNFIDVMAAILGFTVAALKVCCPWMQQERMCFIIQSLMEDWSSVGDNSAILIFPGCDAFVFSVVLHLCGQFEVLNQSFENVPHDESDLDHKRRIREYSRRHNKLLTLGNELNDLVSLIIFSELFSNGMVICLSGIVILSNIKRGNVSDDDINYGVRIYIWYCELFMYSYVGEQLASQSEKIQKTIYGCPWYSMSVNTAKEIKFIMMRNNSFCYLTAGGILVMNYETFKDITRIMFSSCSVLKLILE
ncbi:odorant receptor 47a-like isoform X3 [Diachasmimorpha longicaudata]|uniref:odorant receptor 47a-like isoform X3 n=1 Tax=Diachasmimorpha longicaudata TaxID=58733 RepID=UPI0030B89871